VPVLYPFNGGVARRGEGAPPTIRGSFSGNANATSVTTSALPSGTTSGDIGIMTITVGQAQTSSVTTPTGWTLMGTNYNSGPLNHTSAAASMYAVYKKRLTGADASTTITVTFSQSDIAVVVGTVIKGGSDIGVGPAFSVDNIDHTAGTLNNLIVFPALRPGPQDLVILCGAAQSGASGSAFSTTLTAAPSGFTILENVSEQATPSLTPVVGAFICSGPASSFNGITATPTTGATFIEGGGCSLSISPVGRRPTDQVPVALQGASLHGYGNSYMEWVNPPATPAQAGPALSHTSHFAEALYITRLAAMMGGPFDFDGYGGGIAADICGGVYGSAVYWTRGSSLDTNYGQQRAITWFGKSNRSGLVVLDCVGDDVLGEYLAPTTFAKQRAGAVNATDAMIRLFRASSIVEQTDSSVTLRNFAAPHTPATDFTVSSATIYSGGSITSTTTPGDTFTITTTQPSIDIVLLAIDNAALGTNGAPFSVTVDGVAWTTGTTSNQMCKSTSTNFAAAPSVQMCVPCYSMGSGTHTIVITHTGTSGQILCMDGYLIPSSTPPIVLIPTIEHVNETAAGFAGINALADVYTALVKTIPSRFPPASGVLIYEVLANGLWDYTTMLNTADYVHPLEAGSAFYAQGICRTLQEQAA
jgi:hypothetical protein